MYCTFLYICICFNIRFVATYKCHSRLKVAGDTFEVSVYLKDCARAVEVTVTSGMSGASQERCHAVLAQQWEWASGAHRSIGLDGRMMDGWRNGWMDSRAAKDNILTGRIRGELCATPETLGIEFRGKVPR